MPNTPALYDQVKAYNPDLDQGILKDAVEFAKRMHEGQTRSSGEPYYTLSLIHI